MQTWTRLTGLARFAFRLRGLLDKTVTVDEAAQSIRAGVERRCDRFWLTFDKAIHANARSPYRALLSAAGCEPGDVRTLVEKDGLEGALQALAQAGVYVSYEEFKGRTPAIRGSQTFHFRPEDFDDPLVTPHVAATSGGTRGPATRAAIDADHIEESTPYWAVYLADNGCLDTPLIFWTPGHAGVAGRYLACARAGQKYSHWFVSEPMHGPKDRLYANCIHGLSRLAGDFPSPEPAPFSDPLPVLNRLLALIDAGKRPSVQTAPSAAVTLSLAAAHRGRTLEGVTFLLGSEPLTPARHRTIESSGARALPLYGSSEAPWIGGQCHRPRHPDEVHVFADGYAVIGLPDDDDRAADGSGGQRLLFTSLRRALPKILINVDIGDRAVLSSARCDCLYDQIGCHLRLHTIRSSDKITEFGVTFALPDVFQVLEEVLPRQFGGSAGDYQLVEGRDASGLPRYTMRINPAVPLVSDERVPEAFLAAMGSIRDFYRAMATTWARERLIAVKRAPPLATPAGKVLPFHRTAESVTTEFTSR